MVKKLHILFINGWYPSRVLPTNGDFIKRHAEAVALQHEVTAIHVISDPNLKKSIEITEETINRVKTFIAYIKHSENKLIKAVRYIRAYYILIRRTGRFDVVHINILYPVGLVGLILKLFYKKPYIISEHWTGYQQAHSNKIGYLQRKLSKIIVKRAAFICPVTNSLKTSMEQLGLKGNYQPVPNVVDTDLFIPKKTENETFTILHISSMYEPHKNISGILKAYVKLCQKVEKVKMILIGEGSPELSKMVNDFNIELSKIKLIDHISQQKLIAYYHKANIFILFSNYENLPCVILESFATGTPVIATRVGGISEYFPDTFGVLIPPKDENQLEEMLLKIYKKESRFADHEVMHAYAEKHFGKKTISSTFSKLYYHSIENKQLKS